MSGIDLSEFVSGFYVYERTHLDPEKHVILLGKTVLVAGKMLDLFSQSTEEVRVCPY